MRQIIKIAVLFVAAIGWSSPQMASAEDSPAVGAYRLYGGFCSRSFELRSTHATAEQACQAAAAARQSGMLHIRIIAGSYEKPAYDLLFGDPQPACYSMYRATPQGYKLTGIAQEITQLATPSDSEPTEEIIYHFASNSMRPQFPAERRAVLPMEVRPKLWKSFYNSHR